MAYADQQMSGNRVVAIIIVALIHVALGYALITGLAYSAIKKAVERVTTVDIEEEVPEEEPPPPPPDEVRPPPVVVPPAPIQFNPPVFQPPTVSEPPPPAPVVPRAAPPSPPPPPPPPPARVSPRGNPSSWVTNDDYPARAMREERSGTTRFRVTVNAEGRVADCQITGSSGHADLDREVCTLITRRARFNTGAPGQWGSNFVWRIPED